MNETYTFLSIILVPLTASIFLYLYKSKCQSIKLCYGALEINRDVIGEEITDRLQTNNTQNNIELSAII